MLSLHLAYFSASWNVMGVQDTSAGVLKASPTELAIPAAAVNAIPNASWAETNDPCRAGKT